MSGHGIKGHGFMVYYNVWCIFGHDVINPFVNWLQRVNDEFPYSITFQTTIYVDVWDADDGSISVHLIDNFTIAIPGTVSNCVNQSNSLIVQGHNGIGVLTLTYFNLTNDPITSCSSANLPIPTSKSITDCYQITCT